MAGAVATKDGVPARLASLKVMSAHAYTEDPLVEQPAIGLFAEPGWAVAGPPPNAGVAGAGVWPFLQDAGVAGEPCDAGLLGREAKGKVVWVSRLSRPSAGLERLNPALPPEAIAAAMDELTRDRSSVCRSSVQVKAN